ncbi:SRPBCC domain-containing protein [Solwaraspora sp. WMMD791]|uniref:SRPBCC family protein n=1 Tax=Solwaraspora sp. WMMD791 TaxID=3016086 RepID=UPI00249A1E41|nr:SRPBCC domain-containing protein [Solwaraspora sp. WMMD791]WFE26717.1 SRPBCC domain-containing protein [Solwaraspora sp. WMMD791]
MGHEFEVRKEIELAATPEQVWDAIATGPGLDSWFMGRSEIEPREGGAARLTLGGHTDEATIVGWEPGKRYADRTATADDGSFMALEYLIEGRDQGSTVLRMVQSGMLGDNWETEFEAMKIGWDLYLGTLAAYLRYFPGRTATPVTVLHPDAGDPDQVWPAVAAALGTAHPIAAGAPVRLAVPGAAPIDGTVDLAEPTVFLGVRTTGGLYRFVHSGRDRGDMLFLSHHIFDTDAEPVHTEQRWQQWLDQLPVS